MNENSRRYVDTPPSYYMPDKWRMKAENKKQGSSSEVYEGTYYHEYVDRVYELASRCYDDMIKDGIAPEQARMILPQAMMTSWYWSGSLDAFANMYNLRSKEDSQQETREIALAIGNIAKEYFPVGWSALVG